MISRNRGREAADTAPSPAAPGTPRGGLAGRLFAPVDIASLVFFRVAFGLVMVWEVLRYMEYGWISSYWIEPAFNFTYFGFGWVQPWPGNWMYVHFVALGMLAGCIMLGLFYRIAAALFFVGFTYVFLLEQAQYLNHFYLICLISLLLIFVPAHRALSIDAWQNPRLRSQTVPAWALGILAAQMGIAYFYGGLAKLNADWLRGEPMSGWLAPGGSFPVIGPLFTQEWSGYFFSYGGLLFDLLIVPLLLWRRTRMAAFIAAFAFHATNAELFQIGIFPWLAIAATTLFLPPSWPRDVAHRLRDLRRPTRERAPREDDGQSGPARRDGGSMALGLRGLQRRQYVVVALLGAFLAVQLLVPFRHFLYPGNVSWTEEGHRFAWHMKLRSVDGDAAFGVTDPASGRIWWINPEQYLTERQAGKMAAFPDMILQFSHYLADTYETAGYENVEVRAVTLVSLNGREPQSLVDPTVDLADQPRSLAPAPWILPLEEPLRANADAPE